MRTNNDILYHYCSTATFHSIISGGTVRLSSMSLSNDAMEGRLLMTAFKRLIQKDAIEGYRSKELIDQLELMENLFDGLGFCLSEDGDLLSQWRGYADDGKGVAIGFSKNYFQWLSGLTKDAGKLFELVKVEYGDEAHEAEITPTYEKIRDQIYSGAFMIKNVGSPDIFLPEGPESYHRRLEEARTLLQKHLTPLLTTLFRLKSKAFEEEKEWRLLSDRYRHHSTPCEFRAEQNRLIPFRSIPLKKDYLSIVEVVLGPKHISPPEVINTFITNFGFTGVQVLQSSATYR